jgi:hypothetical protein
MHGKMRNSYKILVANARREGHFKAVDIDGRIILKRILNK